MAFKESVFINAPVEKVFEVTTDFRHAKSIMNNVVKAEQLTEGPFQVGTQISEVRKMGGKEIETILMVTEHIPNQKYAVKSEKNGITVEYQYRFSALENGTTIDFEGIIQTKGLINSLLKPLIEFFLKKEDKDHLVKLKSYIENLDT